MSSTNSINAVRNINSGVVFVLVDNELSDKMTIINPEGKVLTVPGGLFEAPFAVSEDKVQESFTEKQLLAIEKHMYRGRSKSTGLKTPRKKRVTKKTPVKTGLGAEWSGAKLTFYKHKIEPLSEKQTFKVSIEGTGVFTISKEDFCKLFNDVIISSSYWGEGSYTYDQLPEKAEKFIEAQIA